MESWTWHGYLLFRCHVVRMGPGMSMSACREIANSWDRKSLSWSSPVYPGRGQGEVAAGEAARREWSRGTGCKCPVGSSAAVLWPLGASSRSGDRFV